MARWCSVESRLRLLPGAPGSWSDPPWCAQDDDHWDTRSEAAVQQSDPPGYIRNCIVLLGKKRSAETDPTAKAQIGEIEAFLGVRVRVGYVRAVDFCMQI